MKHPRFALIMSGFAAVAIAVLIAMGAGTNVSHTAHPGGSELSNIAGDQPSGGASGTTAEIPAEHSHPGASGSDAPESAGSSTADPAAGDPAAGDPGNPDPQAAAATGQGQGAATPETDPANIRQVGLAEAAGKPAGLAAGEPEGLAAGSAAAGPAPGSIAPGIDPEAAGVNEGTKKQAADVPLQVAPSVGPLDILPSNGQVSGCVGGYGRGAVCLPQTPPSHAGHGQLGSEDLSVYWTCTEVRTLLPDGVVVDSPTSDRLGLDSNGDGTACGAGDA